GGRREATGWRRIVGMRGATNSHKDALTNANCGSSDDPWFAGWGRVSVDDFGAHEFKAYRPFAQPKIRLDLPCSQPGLDEPPCFCFCGMVVFHLHRQRAGL